jgi:hypothetical protein
VGGVMTKNTQLKRLASMGVCVFTLLFALIGAARADEAVGFDITAIDYENQNTRDTVIITLDTSNMPTVDSYGVTLYDSNQQVRRRVPFPGQGSNRLRLHLPQALPAGNYLIQIVASDAAGITIAEAARDFVHTPLTSTSVPTLTPAPTLPPTPNPTAVPLPSTTSSADTTPLLPIVVLSVLTVGSVGFAAQHYRRRRQGALAAPLHASGQAGNAPLVAAPFDAGRPAPLVFVSYSHDDWDEFVEPLTRYLASEGLSVWVDQHLIRGGHDWQDDINRALEQCACMILCMSKDALESRFVKVEYRFFFNNGKKLYPLLCRPVDTLPPELQTIQYYTYDQLEKLVTVVKSELPVSSTALQNTNEP